VGKRGRGQDRTVASSTSQTGTAQPDSNVLARASCSAGANQATQRFTLSQPVKAFKAFTFTARALVLRNGCPQMRLITISRNKPPGFQLTADRDKIGSELSDGWNSQRLLGTNPTGRSYDLVRAFIQSGEGRRDFHCRLR